MTLFQETLKEKIETLDGSRRGEKSRAAVRIEDLADLMNLPIMKSADVTSAPTASDFNALRQDVRAMNQRIRALAEVLRGRMS